MAVSGACLVWHRACRQHGGACAADNRGGLPPLSGLLAEGRQCWMAILSIPPPSPPQCPLSSCVGHAPHLHRVGLTGPSCGGLLCSGAGLDCPVWPDSPHHLSVPSEGHPEGGVLSTFLPLPSPRCQWRLSRGALYPGIEPVFLSTHAFVNMCLLWPAVPWWWCTAVQGCGHLYCWPATRYLRSMLMRGSLFCRSSPQSCVV